MNAPVKITIAAGTGIAMALSAGITAANAAPKEKCYGITVAGENDCGNLSKTHSCQGQSTVSYGGGEWQFVPKGTCADTVETDADGNEHHGMSTKQAKAAMES
ncbi:MAG: hypothetical protein COA47_11475 [Robiginitomaculum sp.]|nr:MAG: hypothetical protein COA47_11475 [Robiginitomaculum sp.]